MATQSDGLIRRTQKGLSLLAFETTKQSRILKKRMRAVALQKEIKADLRDLGNLVYNAVVTGQKGILEEEEISILVDSIRGNKDEVERLRDAVARLGRARKHFLPGDEDAFADYEAPAPQPDEQPELVVESAPEAAPPAEGEEGYAAQGEPEEAVLEPEPAPEPQEEQPAAPAKAKAKRSASSKSSKKPAQEPPGDSDPDLEGKE